MRTFRRLFVSLLLVSAPVLASAVTIRVQDPNFTNITGTPSTFSFKACPGAGSAGGPYLDHGTPISADGCFGAVNEAGALITSLTLTFQNTAAIQNSGVNAAGSDIFSNASFIAPTDPTDSNAVYQFLFSGSGLIEGQTFVVTEDGVMDPSQFPVVTLTFATPTPEPSSLLLMATGLAGSGALFSRRKRS